MFSCGHGADMKDVRIAELTDQSPRKKVRTLLTYKLVAEIGPPKKGNHITWDGGTGFGIRVTSAGARAFILRYRNASGADKQITIGSPPAWNVTRARKHADALRHEIDKGADPLAHRQNARGAPTVAELADRFEV
jgi:Arm DNA-binding domain